MFLLQYFRVTVRESGTGGRVAWDVPGLTMIPLLDYEKDQYLYLNGICLWFQKE